MVWDWLWVVTILQQSCFLFAMLWWVLLPSMCHTGCSAGWNIEPFSSSILYITTVPHTGHSVGLNAVTLAPKSCMWHKGMLATVQAGTCNLSRSLEPAFSQVFSCLLFTIFDCLNPLFMQYYMPCFKCVASIFSCCLSCNMCLGDCGNFNMVI